MRILITAGDGGHTDYAVAIAQRLKNKAELIFAVPEGDEWSASRVRKYGEVIYIRKAREQKDPLWRSVPGLTKSFIQSIS